MVKCNLSAFWPYGTITGTISLLKLTNSCNCKINSNLTWSVLPEKDKEPPKNSLATGRGELGTVRKRS